MHNTLALYSIPLRMNNKYNANHPRKGSWQYLSKKLLAKKVVINKVFTNLIGLSIFARDSRGAKPLLLLQVRFNPVEHGSLLGCGIPLYSVALLGERGEERPVL